MEIKLVFFIISIVLYIVGILQIVKYIAIKKRKKQSAEIWANRINAEHISRYRRYGNNYDEYVITLEYEFNKELKQYKYKTLTAYTNIVSNTGKEIIYVDRQTGEVTRVDESPFTFLKLSVALMLATACLIISLTCQI